MESAWAASARAKAVRAEHVDRALEHRVYRVNLTEEVLRERIAEGLVLLDLEGSKTGQVNGLALLDQGDYVFCQPSRITATTAMGRAGVIDLEREAEMSGSSHTKGVLILTGFLRERFAQKKPLTLTASVCFEQNYGGVEGDSASSAELYALLSSLSGVALHQGIAVTGSVNQMAGPVYRRGQSENRRLLRGLPQQRPNRQPGGDDTGIQREESDAEKECGRRSGTGPIQNLAGRHHRGGH